MVAAANICTSVRPSRQHVACCSPLPGPPAALAGRVFNVPSRGEALQNIIWRSLYDCRRNSISGLAQKYYSQNELDGVGCAEMLRMVRQRGVEWEDQDPARCGGSTRPIETPSRPVLSPPRPSASLPGSRRATAVG